MQTILKTTTLLLLLTCFIACNDEAEEALPQTLEVNYANLNGTWQLVKWNEAEIEPGLYCYITFDRNERTFKMYQKFDSMYARCITGSFSIEEDYYLGYLISGTYDYEQGAWNHEYIVTDLTVDGSMTWTAKDDVNDQSIYRRCDGVPEEIVAEARDEFTISSFSLPLPLPALKESSFPIGGHPFL